MKAATLALVLAAFTLHARPEAGVWTIETYAAHNEAIRQAEEKFQQERDRRYSEVKSAEEKALRVKEEADAKALLLAREIQTYKDEKANNLRTQIEGERGSYVTKGELVAAVEKLEATLKPLVNYAATQQGRGSGLDAGWGYVVGVGGLVFGVLSLVRKKGNS